MKRPAGNIVLLAVCVLVPVAVGAVPSGPDEARRDPFEPPAAITRPAAVIQDVEQEEAKEEFHAEVMLILKATMVNGSFQMANVNGRMLRPGDSIEGYTLLRVGERQAVFTRDGEERVVELVPAAAVRDEQTQSN